MENLRKGFIVPCLIAVIALLVIGGGVYVYNNEKTKTPILDTETQQTDTQTSNSGLKTYTDVKQGYSFQYPEKLSLTSSGDTLYLLHSIPFDNYDGGCDLKGDSKLSKTLNDFNLSVKVVSGGVNPSYVDGNYSKGVLNGKWAYMGAEGCGLNYYYFPISGNRTLIITKGQIQMLSTVVSPEVRAKILAVPGVISYEDSEIIFNQILSTFKFTR